MKILTEFKNRKVVHQEVYEDRIIVVTKLLSDGFTPERYSTFICNKRFDVLSDSTHSEGDESIETSISLAKQTINQFL